MSLNDITFVAGGPAGAGVITIGETLGKLFQRLGWYVFIYDDYPSLIKGGHNAIYVRASTEKIYSQRKSVDIVIALDKLSIDRHLSELHENSIIIYNAKEIKDYPHNYKGVPVDFEKLATEAGNPRYFNMVAIGAVFALLDSEGRSLDVLSSIVRERFGKKGEEIVNANTRAARLGFDAVSNTHLHLKGVSIEILSQNNRLLLTGNDGISLGAVKAGVKFHAQYPMTPASTILERMASFGTAKGIVVRQPEDEISVINHVIGAAVAGARATAATSGGGFCLMVEALGFAGLAEIPVVVIDSQRSGPSTGMPTYSEQGDLRFAMHASHGDFPRIVLAPGDQNECFYMTFDALNFAEMYQTPVIILSDKYLSSSFSTVDYFDTSNLKINRGKLMKHEEMESYKDFKRHELTEDGISPRSVPGMKNGIHVASSYEHDETGATTEDPSMKVAQQLKRNRKLSSFPEDYSRPKVYSISDSGIYRKSPEEKPSEIGLITWGSTKMPALESLKLFRKNNMSVDVIHFNVILPFPEKTTLSLLPSYHRLVNIEANSFAQFASVIREHTGIKLTEHFLKFDGRPYHPEDIFDYVASH